MKGSGGAFASMYRELVETIGLECGVDADDQRIAVPFDNRLIIAAERNRGQWGKTIRLSLGHDTPMADW